MGILFTTSSKEQRSPGIGTAFFTRATATLLLSHSYPDCYSGTLCHICCIRRSATLIHPSASWLPVPLLFFRVEVGQICFFGGSSRLPVVRNTQVSWHSICGDGRSKAAGFALAGILFRNSSTATELVHNGGECFWCGMEAVDRQRGSSAVA